MCYSVISFNPIIPWREFCVILYFYSLSLAVSYTHLDVYKRQVLHNGMPHPQEFCKDAHGMFSTQFTIYIKPASSTEKSTKMEDHCKEFKPKSIGKMSKQCFKIIYYALFLCYDYKIIILFFFQYL